MHIVTSEQNSQSTYTRRSRADWIEIIQAWQSSSLTQREFCSQNSIALSSFYKWRQKLSSGSQDATPTHADGFVNVFSSSQERSVSEGDWQIELDLGGISLRLSRG